MQTITLPGGSIVLYDSPSRLPESRRVLYTYYMAFHSGIGSTMGDVDRHFEPIVSLIGANEIESAITEINNLRYLLFGLMNKQTAPNALAFCCCIHSVNNVRWDDFVEEGLEKLLGQLSEYGLTQEHIVSYHQLYEKKS